METLTLMWWPCISPVQPYPRSGPWCSCPPHEYCVWQTPPRWCSCSPGWTHSEWNGTTGCSSPHQSLQWVPLENIRKFRARLQTWYLTTLHSCSYKKHFQTEGINIHPSPYALKKKKSLKTVLESKPQTKMCTQSINNVIILKAETLD